MGIKHFFIVVLTILLTYGNGVKNNYSLDDHLVIKNDKISEMGWKDVFSTFSFTEKNGYVYSYRPTLIASFLAEYKVFGKNPHVSHIISILLYIVVCILLYGIIISLGGSATFALISTLIFAVYPIHTEVIDNIKSRDELFVNVFGLLSILIYVRKGMFKNNLSKNIVLFLVILLGLMTKQSFYVFIGVLFAYGVYEVLVQYYSKKKFFKILGVTLSAMVVLWLIKNTLLEGTSIRIKEFYENPLYETSLFNRVLPGLSVTGFNTVLLFYPLNLSYYYGYNTVPLSNLDANFFFYMIVGTGMLILLVFVLINQYKNRLVVFSTLILAISLISVSNVPKPLPGIVAERFLFSSSIGFILLGCYFISRVLQKEVFLKLKKVQIVFVVVFIALQSAYCINRNKDWNSEYSIALADVDKYQNSVKLKDLASFQMLNKMKRDRSGGKVVVKETIDSAEVYLKQCIEIYPEHQSCLNNLATLYYSQGKYELAKVNYNKALKFDSANVNILFNLAYIYNEDKILDSANIYYQKAILCDPNLQDLIPAYKLFLINNGLNNDADNFSAVEAEAEKMNEPVIYMLLVDLYNVNNDMKSTLKYLKILNDLDSTHPYKQYIEELESRGV